MKKRTREMMGLTALGMAALMAAAVSCKKSDGEAAPSLAQGVFRAAAEAQSCDSKTEITSSRAVLWTSGDAIRVYNSAYAHYDFTLADGAGSSEGEFAEPAGVEAEFYDNDYAAFYPAGKADHGASGYTMTLPATQNYAKGTFGREANPMACKAGGTSLMFQNLCGTLMLKLASNKHAKVQKIKVVSRKTSDHLNGTGKVAFASGGATLSMTSGDNFVTLNCVTDDNPDGVDISEATDFYIVLPGGTLGGGFDVEVTMNKEDGGAYVYSKGVGGTVDNTIQTAYVRAMPKVDIQFGFVVDNESGKTVEFAKGNLYWEPDGNTAGKWGIEERQWQYDVVGVDETTYEGLWNPAHVSHFYWTDDAALASAQAYPTGDDAVTFFTETADGFEAYEGTEKKTWRTLDDQEWKCIIDGRKVSYHRYAKVYMHPTNDGQGGVPSEVAGLLLFPAEWTLPPVGERPEDFVELQNAFANNSLFNTDNFVKEEWLADNNVYAGCVFLPCAGYRDGSSSSTGGTAVKYVGTRGGYWSSVPNGSNAWDMHFLASDVYMNSHYRFDARCVRPVRVSEN